MDKSALSKKERSQIFSLFLEREKLKFSEIEKALGIRSNMVSYHLEMLVKQGLIQKKGIHYSLTEEAEKHIPLHSATTMTPIPVILVALTHKNKILLIKRKKRPYKDYYAMIGGKILLGETFKEAALRLIKTKTGLKAKFKSLNAVFHEQILSKKETKHSFILFLVRMQAENTEIKQSGYGELKWLTIKQAEKLTHKKIVPSDSWLIKNKLSAKVKVEEAHMEEKDGKLKNFEMIK